jgi:ABC-2 type transport system ATP-binding protein
MDQRIDGKRVMAAIEAVGLTKTFGAGKKAVRALDGLDLEVSEGRVLGLLGPNGAGKTTTVRMLTTLLTPDSGQLRVLGHDVCAEPDEVRRLIGLSGQFSAIDENLTGRENLWMFGRLYGLPSAAARERAEELLEQFELEDAGDRVCKTYSGGMKRRLDLAGSLIAHPKVLFLDEPTTGLDPKARMDLWDIIRDRVRSGVTLLLTTQYLEEADLLADSIAVINHGRVIAEGTSDALKSQVGGERIEVVVHDPARLGDAHELLALLSGDGMSGGGIEVDHHTRKLTAPTAAGSAGLVHVIRDLDAAGIAIDDIGLRRPTLDDVFMSLTGHTASDEEHAAVPAGRKA